MLEEEEEEEEEEEYCSPSDSGKTKPPWEFKKKKIDRKLDKTHRQQTWLNFVPLDEVLRL